tara:strand:- start:8377 stop:8835 length:459 start_codon:yes stop_codon:yes gene_type:complete
MSCENFTNYVDTINNLCGVSISNIMESCNSYCLLSIIHLINNCLKFIVVLELDKELEGIVEFCYNKNHPSHRRLTKMTDFNINELMLFIVGVLGALGGLCVITQRSKCKSFCWGCLKRDVDAVLADEKLKMTGHSGDTPKVRPTLDAPVVSA